MTVSERRAQPQRTQGVSMNDLLASCAAASAVSTPPKQRETDATEPAEAQDPAGEGGARRDAA